MVVASKQASPIVLRPRVALLGVKPTVWRRLEVTAGNGFVRFAHQFRSPTTENIFFLPIGCSRRTEVPL